MGQQCSFGKSTLYSPPDSPIRHDATQNGEATTLNYNREQTMLRELFSAIRTGLVASEAEFDVLPPGIATSAKVKLRVGSSLAETSPENRSAPASDMNMQTKEEEEAEEEENAAAEERPYVEEMTLNGPGWARGLHMHLSIRPIVGPFAGRKLLMSWSKNTLRAEGSEAGELNSRTIPESFEDETEFCKCCLLLAYHADPSSSFTTVAEEEGEKEEKAPSEGMVVPLKMAAYQTLISNLDAIPKDACIPSKVYHLLYGSQGPVDVTIQAWPSTSASLFGTDPRMRVKSGILFAEFLCLLRARFHLSPSHAVKLYHNHMPVHFTDLISVKYDVIDCFVTERSGSDSVYGSYSSDIDVVPDSDPTLVVSLVGYCTQNITANLDMKMSDFDLLLRENFSLKADSFLLIVAEDDFTPQYSCYDNWKCVYSFALPDSSFSAGLRRSFRRLSFRKQRSTDAQQQRILAQEKVNEALMPHLDKVTQFLSSNSRHFPSNLGKSGFEVEQLFQMMPMYQRSLDQCGIHPHTIIQVFEVTGPSIPIVFRVVSNPSQDSTVSTTATATTSRQHDSSATPQSSRTRLTNIMDINPDWPLCTFLRYVDAIVSPGSVVRRKRRLAMGPYSLEDWDEQPELTLGKLLTQWKPVWWPPVGGSERKPLTIKDIDPAQFLVIEKY